MVVAPRGLLEGLDKAEAALMLCAIFSNLSRSSATFLASFSV
jgi:hypothetical protein